MVLFLPVHAGPPPSLLRYGFGLYAFSVIMFSCLLTISAVLIPQLLKKKIIEAGCFGPGMSCRY